MTSSVAPNEETDNEHSGLHRRSTLFAVGYAGCFEAVMLVTAKTVGLAGSDVSDVAIDAK